VKFVTGDTLREFREFRKRMGIRDPVIDTFLLMEPPRLQFPEPAESPVQVKFVCMGHWVQQDQVSGLWYPWGEVPEREPSFSGRIRDVVEEFQRRERGVYNASWEHKSIDPLKEYDRRSRLIGHFGAKS